VTANNQPPAGRRRTTSAAASPGTKAGSTKAGSRREAGRSTKGKTTQSAPTSGKAGTAKPAATKATTGKAGTQKPATKNTNAPTVEAPVEVLLPVPASRQALVAGAARASGERRRRSGTPLISGPGLLEVSAARRQQVAAPPTPPAPDAPTVRARADSPGTAEEEASQPESRARTRPPRKAIRERREQRARERVLRPVPSVEPEPADLRPAPSGTGERERAQRHTAILGDAAGALDDVTAGLQERASRLVGAVLEAAEFSSEARPGPAELVELAINVLRAAASAAGVPAEDIEQHVAHTLAYVRRRLTGDYEVDEFGFDEDYTTHIHLPVLRPLYKNWFRVEVKGIENIPSEGGALVVANHSGTVALDSLMTQVAVYDEHPAHRHLRMLGADLVFQTPFVGAIARRSGTTLAATSDAERLLGEGHLVGVWPEGFKGIGKPYSERYKLQRFGRGGFVSAALKSGVPIVPCSIVGAEEIYPIIGNMPTVARLLGVPYAPITPTFPWLGPLGLIPLPSKWLIEFGPPIDTTSLGPEAADDPMLVFDLTDQVRETIQQTLYSLLMQRRSVFI